MSVSEAVGCGLLALGPAFWLLALTAADALRIIALAAAAFCWLLALLLASLLRAALPEGGYRLPLALVFSICTQELVRFGVYKLFRRTENGLRQIADIQMMNNNKHVFAYVSGLGFGIISGAFAITNVLADAVGPATVGLKSGHDMFFITSAAMALCMILLHTFWSVIFFNALDDKNYIHILWVIGSHFLVSGLSLLNKYELYYASILPAYVVLIITVVIAYKSIGGSLETFKKGFSMASAEEWSNNS